jgi:hypothetical protein
MRTLSMRIVTYLIEYLGEFEFVFKTILDYESGDQMGSFDETKPPSKISCLGTFKIKNRRREIKAQETSVISLVPASYKS